MAVISLSQLKTKFETGDVPTGADYADLIDTTSYYATSLESRIESLEASQNTVITGVVNSGTATILDEWAMNTSKTIEYTIKITQGSKQYCEKMTILANDELINYTKYAIIAIGTDMTGLAIIPTVYTSGSGRTGRLTVQITDANMINAQVKVLKTLIA